LTSPQRQINKKTEARECEQELNRLLNLELLERERRDISEEEKGKEWIE
jgi:hypothetical protein